MRDFKDIDFSELNTDDLSRGFWELDVPATRIISMPICDACKHVKYDENNDIICSFYGEVDLDRLQSEGCIDLKDQCKDFEADEESCLYELLMEHVEEAKKKLKK